MNHLETKHLSFRLVTEDDFELLYQVNLNPDIEQYSGAIYLYHKKESAEYYEKRLEDGDLLFMVTRKSDNAIIGEAGITDFHSRNQTAEVHLIIFDTENHKQGYGTEIVEFLEHYAFEILSLRKLKAWIYGYNTASIRLFEKCHFVLHGREVAERL